MIETQGSYLGRYQAGDMVPLRLWCINRATDSPARPDRAPWFTVSRLGDGVVFSEDRMPTEDYFGTTGQFCARLRLNNSFTPGTYLVVYSYIVEGRIYRIRDQFQVMPGSDASGTVISLFYYRHPETGYVLAQLTSGVLVLGRNPKV